MSHANDKTKDLNKQFSSVFMIEDRDIPVVDSTVLFESVNTVINSNEEVESNCRCSTDSTHKCPHSCKCKRKTVNS